ncbi:MAG: Ferredoxin, partial [uncultured Rubrobacteraceae bacterium]
WEHRDRSSSAPRWGRAGAEKRGEESSSRLSARRSRGWASLLRRCSATPAPAATRRDRSSLSSRMMSGTPVYIPGTCRRSSSGTSSVRRRL